MSDDVTRILVVANRTAAAPRLLEEVARRARESPCAFDLLIPVTPGVDSDWTQETAIPLLERAARTQVATITGVEDPFTAIQDALRRGGYEEIIISTLPRGVSKWLKRDLVSRVEKLGLPVTTVIPDHAETSTREAITSSGIASGGAGGSGIP